MHSTRYCKNAPHCPQCGGPHLASVCKVDRVRGLEECNGEGMEDEEIEDMQPPYNRTGGVGRQGVSG